MKINRYGLSFIVFGIICLITAWILSFSVGNSVKQRLPAKGGKFGPIQVDKKNEIVEIKVSQNVDSRHWSSIEAEVLDDKNKYLFAFSEELWFETGYDSEGQWKEGKQKYDISITFPQPGKYFIKFSSANSRSSNVGDIRVVVNKKLGSSIAHNWMGYISLFLGIAILYFSRKSKGPNKRRTKRTGS